MYTTMAQHLAILLTVCAVAVSPLSAQQLAVTNNSPVTGPRGSSEGVVRGTITAPITTGFATYRPFPIPRFTPTVGLSEAPVRPDLSNVATATPITFNTYFTDAERGMLVRQGFVARPEGIGSFGVGYAYEASSRPMGSFVTVDAVTHGLRVTLDEALRDFEIGYATNTLAMEFAMLSEELARQLDAASSPVIQRSLQSLLGYTQTGQYLLNQQSPIDARVATQVRDEARKIMQASDRVESSVLTGVIIDYTLFRTNDQYASDARRASFFRARQWSARVPIVLRDQDGDVQVENARRAFLLTQTIVSLSTKYDFDRSHQLVEEPIAFFTGGESDSYQTNVIASAARRYYGILASTGSTYLANDAEVSSLTNSLAEGTAGNRPILFRLHAWSDGRGGDQVDDIVRVASTNSSDYRSLFGLRRGESSESWLTTVDRSFMYMLQPLALTNGDQNGLPRFMQGDAWHDRNLASALGGVTDVSLPVSMSTMKSLQKAGKYGGESAVGTDGYIEPSPDAWGRLAALARYIRVGLATEKGMISGGITAKLLDIERTSARLMQISITELTGAPVSADDRDVISSMRTRVIAYETPIDPMLRRGGYTTPRASSARSGNGFPMAIYVIVPRNDGVPGLMLTRGAIYTYGDAFDPQGSRRPETRPAQWTSTFVSPDRSFTTDGTRLVGIAADLPPTAVAYTPTKDEAKSTAQFAEISVESSNVSRLEGELWFTIGIRENDRRELFVTLVDQDGRVVRRMDLGRLREQRRLELISVDDLREGLYALHLEDALGQTLASARVRVLP